MKSKDSPNSEAENLNKIIRAIENRKNSFSEMYQGTYLKFLISNKSSPAVKAKCYDCVTEDLHDAILDCRGFSCPLYFVRPYQYQDTEFVKNQVRINFKIPLDADGEAKDD